MGQNKVEMGQAEHIRNEIVAWLSQNGPFQGTKAAFAEALGYDRTYSSVYSAIRQLEGRDVIETVLGERGSYKRIQLRGSRLPADLTDDQFTTIVLYIQKIRDENFELKAENIKLRAAIMEISKIAKF